LFQCLNITGKALSVFSLQFVRLIYNNKKAQLTQRENARRRCMFEGPLQTNLNLSISANDIGYDVFTYARRPVAVIGRASFAPLPPPVLWPPVIFAKITQISDFFAYQSFRKWVNLWLPLNVQKPKMLRL